MLELAASGAKVLHIRAVEYARRHGVTLHVRSSFNNSEGTSSTTPRVFPKEQTVEESVIAGVAADLTEAKITVVGVPDVPGKAAKIFKIVANTNANVDMIVQNVSAASTGRTDISFTLPKADGERALTALASAQEAVGFESLQYDDQIGKLVARRRRHAHRRRASRRGCSRRCTTPGINIEMISTSEIRISVVDARRQRARRRARRAHGVRARRRGRRGRARRHRALRTTPSPRHPVASDAAAADRRDPPASRGIPAKVPRTADRGRRGWDN